MDNRQAVKAANRRRQCWPDQQPDDPGPQPSSDGCTLWPDGVYRGPCEIHDLRYQIGGDYEDRLFADWELRDGVREHILRASTEEILAIENRIIRAWIIRRGRERAAREVSTAMYVGVRIMGSPWVPFGWRWGKGGAAVWDVSHYRRLLSL